MCDLARFADQRARIGTESCTVTSQGNALAPLAHPRHRPCFSPHPPRSRPVPCRLLPRGQPIQRLSVRGLLHSQSSQPRPRPRTVGSVWTMEISMIKISRGRAMMRPELVAMIRMVGSKACPTSMSLRGGSGLVSDTVTRLRTLAFADSDRRHLSHRAGKPRHLSSGLCRERSTGGLRLSTAGNR